MPAIGDRVASLKQQQQQAQNAISEFFSSLILTPVPGQEGFIAIGDVFREG